MAAADVLLAMKAMKNDKVAAQVAAGDLSGLGSLNLSDNERVLVGRVGTELSADVRGFDATSAAFEALSYIGDEGVPEEMEEDVDEVVGFTFGNPSVMEPDKCNKCKGCSKISNGMMSFNFAQGYKPATPGGYNPGRGGVAPATP